MNERLEAEDLRAVVGMVAGLTHDLGTPLGIINQAASVIVDRLEALTALAPGDQGRALVEDVSEATALILAAVSRARGLLRSFHVLAAGTHAPHVETVDIAALVRETVGLYRLLARDHQLDVRLSTPDRGDFGWTAPPAALSRILLNLLSNADRYAYPDGGGGRVEVTLEASEDGFVVTVADHGRGMSDEERRRIFEPGFTTGADRGGTGLGMAVVHQLVTRELGGRVEVASAPGEGTRVVLELPRTSTPNQEPEEP